jgi:hypothetical protein
LDPTLPQNPTREWVFLSQHTVSLGSGAKQFFKHFALGFIFGGLVWGHAVTYFVFFLATPRIEDLFLILDP